MLAWADGVDASLAALNAVTTTYAPLGIYENFDPANFRRFRAALARQRAGGAVARINVYGDSNSAGYQAGLGADYTRGFAACAATILEGTYGPSRTGVIAPAIESAPAVDPRFTLGSGWSGFLSTSQGIGGSGSLQGTGLTAGTASIVGTNVNAFDVYFARYAGGPATVDISIDAGAAVHTACNGANAVVKATVTTGTVGTHTLNIKNATTGTSYVLGVEGYDNTQTGLRWTAVGILGGTSDNWNLADSGDPWSPSSLNFGPSLPAPDLTVINLSINAHTAGTTQAAYLASMSTFITKAAAVGDVILIASAPGGSGDVSTWGDFLTSQRTLAATFGCGLINMPTRWGVYAAASASPYLLWHDADHPTIAGYWDLGQALADGVRLAAGRSA